MPFAGSIIMSYNSVIVIQNNATGNWSAYNIQKKAFMNTTTLSTSLVRNPFFIMYNKVYLLLSNGLYQININSTDITAVLASSLPQQNYSLTFGSPLTILYIVGQPYFYLSGPSISAVNSTISNTTTNSSSNSVIEADSTTFNITINDTMIDTANDTTNSSIASNNNSLNTTSE